MRQSVICFGEVLWDVFPDGEKIGGAPLNVALRLNELGISSAIVSKIGEDDLGNRLLAYITDQNLNTAFMQIDPLHETGQVRVQLDEKGSASYTIAHPAAWDKIDVLPALKEAVALSDAFLFGSLVARDSVSKNTLKALLPKAKFKVFDVNLRAPHYSFAILKELMLEAHLIKFNDDELDEIAKDLGCSSKEMKEQVVYIASQTNTKKICVTRGGDGALLYLDGNFIEQKGFPIRVKDTVGAGDSFLATLLEGLLKKSSPTVTLQRACAMGALVAGATGANPKIREEELAQFIQKHA